MGFDIESKFEFLTEAASPEISATAAIESKPPTEIFFLKRRKKKIATTRIINRNDIRMRIQGENKINKLNYLLLFSYVFVAVPL